MWALGRLWKQSCDLTLCAALLRIRTGSDTRLPQNWAQGPSRRPSSIPCIYGWQSLLRPCYLKCSQVTLASSENSLEIQTGGSNTPELLNWNPHFNKISRWFIWTLKFEKHWPKAMVYKSVCASESPGEILKIQMPRPFRCYAWGFFESFPGESEV